MENTDEQINHIMTAISEIVLNAENRENLTKMEKLTQDSALILAKELHLSIVRHNYRVDNARHLYDCLEDLL